MPVICFANPKGGVGKSTSALVLASGLVAAGASVAVVDGDPNRTIFKWAASAGDAGFAVHELPSDNDITDLIDTLADTSAFVIVDLEGSSNLAMTRACSRTDLVIIPLQASPVDARQASRAIALVTAEGKQLRRSIPYRMLFTRVNPAIATRDEREIRAQFAAADIACMAVALNDRAAFRAMFSHYTPLWSLTADQANGLAKARDNAAAFVREVTALLRALQPAGQGSAA